MVKKRSKFIVANKKYSLEIVYKDDLTQPYIFTDVPAANSEEAVQKMKEFVSKNGWFGNMTPEEVLPHLSARNVQEVG